MEQEVSVLALPVMRDIAIHKPNTEHSVMISVAGHALHQTMDCSLSLAMPAATAGAHTSPALQRIPRAVRDGLNTVPKRLSRTLRKVQKKSVSKTVVTDSLCSASDVVSGRCDLLSERHLCQRNQRQTLKK